MNNVCHPIPPPNVLPQSGGIDVDRLYGHYFNSFIIFQWLFLLHIG